MFETHLFLPEKLMLLITQLCSFAFWNRTLAPKQPENPDAWGCIIRSFLRYSDYWKYLGKFCDYFFLTYQDFIVILVLDSSRKKNCIWAGDALKEDWPHYPTRLLQWNISDMTDLFLGRSKSTFASFFFNQLANKGPWQQKYRDSHLSSVPVWKRCQKTKKYVSGLCTHTHTHICI